MINLQTVSILLMMHSDVVNNVRISRCLFYVSNILGQVIGNNGAISKAETLKKAFSISAGDICKFSFSVTPISINEITGRLNAVADLNTFRKLNHTAI